MSWHRLGLLDEIGFSIYEKKALAAIGLLGVADAATLCREGDIPTSKIYRAMEKLAAMGVVEIQPTRPKLYAALPAETVVERLKSVARDRAEAFALRADDLRGILSETPGRLAGRETFSDLALGRESHVKRHLVRLAGAEHRIVSYLEEGDLAAIEQLEEEGFRILRRIARNAQERGVQHRMVFGFRYATAPRLTAFLRKLGPELSHVSGIRYSGEMGHPFHVIDGESVILSLDHPFVPEGRFASLLVRDRELVGRLVTGFETLWEKAMKDLKEIRFHPRD
jgi:sugar-specific transcriptional regulator TrmB